MGLELRSSSTKIWVEVLSWTSLKWLHTREMMKAPGAVYRMRRWQEHNLLDVIAKTSPGKGSRGGKRKGTVGEAEGRKWKIAVTWKWAKKNSNCNPYKALLGPRTNEHFLPMFQQKIWTDTTKKQTQQTNKHTRKQCNAEAGKVFSR